MSDNPRLGSDTRTRIGVRCPMTGAAGSMAMAGAGPIRNTTNAIRPSTTTTIRASSLRIERAMLVFEGRHYSKRGARHAKRTMKRSGQLRGAIQGELLALYRSATCNADFIYR